MRAARTLMQDARLSESARVIGFYIASLGAGWQEVGRDHFRRVLHGPASKDRVSRSLSELELYEYVERRPGGRGHADAFRFSVQDSKTLSDRVQDSKTLSDRVHETKTLNPDSIRETRTLKPDDASKPRPHVREHAGAPVAVAVGSKIAGSTPPIVPPTERASPELDPTAVRYLEQHAGTLNGCGDGLRDYLAARVPPDQQAGYVSAVMTWLSGFGFNWRGQDGRTVPREQWTRLLAAALAELWATDEKARKYPCGDPANLRTKLNHVLRDISRSERYSTRNHGGETSDGRRHAAGTGAGEGRPAAGTPNDGRRIPIG